MIKNAVVGPVLFALLLTAASVQVRGADAKPPSKAHAQMKRLVGNWLTEMKSFYPDPNKPQVTKGRARIRMILGGNFMEQRYAGVVDGKKYQGIATSGYDTAKKKYVGTWIDSLNTGIMVTEGTYDVKTQTLTETGEMSGPGGAVKVKNVTKYMTNDHFVFTMYMVTPQGEQKAFSITYRRIQQKKGKKAKKKKDSQ